MSVSEQTLKAEELSIKDLLSNTIQFKVPINQRDYSWKVNQLDDFFQDIQNTITANDEYFIGLMVFKPGHEDGKLIILDGQQRIVTSIIFIHSAFMELKELRETRAADHYYDEYVSKYAPGQQLGLPKVILNEKNNGKFEEYVIKNGSMSGLKTEYKSLSKNDPSKALLFSIKYWREKILEIEGTDQSVKAQKIIDFVDKFLSLVKVVKFVVRNEDNAYKIFGRLNYRGLDLNVLNLMKNHLSDLADPQSIGDTPHLSELNSTWTKVEEYLKGIDPEIFLKSFWSSRHGLVATTKLYKAFETEVSNWNKAREILTDLRMAAEQYRALYDADESIWTGLGATERSRMKDLNVLGARQIYSILLSALDKFEVREKEKLLKLLEIIITRYYLIGEGRTGSLESSTASAAKKIYDCEITTSRGVFDELHTLYSPDDAFEAQFKIKIENDDDKAKYVLRKIEEYSRSKSSGLGSEYTPPLSLTLEHILPRKPREEWSEITSADPNIVEDCCYLLGNMCLLDRSPNRDLGNKSFDEKKETFRRSDLIHTKEVSRYRTWNRNAITARTKKLAKIAVQTWRYDV